MHKLTSGGCASIEDLAAELDLDRNEISLPLAFLAPDIITAILDGNHPVDLTAKHLKRLADLPMDWNEQRELLGF